MQPIVLGPNLPETFYRGSGRLASFRGAELPALPEDWVASTTTRYGHETAGLTRLDSGTLLIDAIATDPMAWLGTEKADTALLVKLLDAGQRLPVHVHPARPFAQSHLASPYGKTEAWIVVDAAPDAVVHLGFNRAIEPDELSDWVQTQDIATMLGATNRIRVSAGDAILVPAGMPHAIGPDVLLVELQEPTDFSLLLEWEGFVETAEHATLGLSIDQALACVDLGACSPQRLESLRTAAPGSLLPAEAGEFFQARSFGAGDVPAGFSVLVVTQGSGLLGGEWGSFAIHRGNTVVVPYSVRAQVSGTAVGVCCQPPA